MDLVRQSQNKTGMERLLLERERQITNELFTNEHDDKYTKGELRHAATCYELEALNDNNDSIPPKNWPFTPESWKPRGVLRNLEKAGALYLAESDRLLRKNTPADSPYVKFVNERIQIIAEEIDKFLAVLPGDAYLEQDQSKTYKHSFALLHDMNQDGGAKLLLAEAINSKRQATPLYYEEALRRKLGTRPNGMPLASGSILNVGEVCNCDNGFMCQHRLDWLMTYLKQTNNNLMVRQWSNQATIDEQIVQIQDLEERIAELKQVEYDKEDNTDVE